MRKELQESRSDIETFAVMMEFLMKNEREREAFFEAPELYGQKLGLSLSEKARTTLRTISSISIKKKKFNDKLVLCSSSGY